MAVDDGIAAVVDDMVFDVRVRLEKEIKGIKDKTLSREGDLRRVRGTDSTRLVSI